MSLDKAITHHKEKRKPYRGAKAVDSHCRNHGACPWCVGNRTFQSKRNQSAAAARVKAYNEGKDE